MAKKGKAVAKAKSGKKNSGLSQQGIQEMVEKKAYELYEKGGYNHGSDWSDWFEAEKQVTSKRS